MDFQRLSSSLREFSPAKSLGSSPILITEHTYARFSTYRIKASVIAGPAGSRKLLFPILVASSFDWAIVLDVG